MNFARKMPGCGKVTYENQTQLVVAGGEDMNGNKLKSVEMLKINLKSADLTKSNWIRIGELIYARTYFPTVGMLDDSSLIVIGGKLDEEEYKYTVEKYQNNQQWQIWNSMELKSPLKSDRCGN